MGEKVKISLVVIGHVGSGKSTAIGKLADELTVSTSGFVDRVLERVARSLFTYASPLDKLKAERERGIATSSLKFDTTKNNITVTDASGHRDFMKNMITGTSKADYAVIFIDSTPGGFEAGMSKDGQTRGHMELAHTLGIKQLICCCNKMDATIPKYSEERYDEIVRSLSSYLEQIGFDPSKIHFIPISGLGGDNLTGRSTYLDWYDGPTLLEALDEIGEPKTPSDKPLRLPVQDVYKNGIGTVPVGRIETGILKPDMKITFGPTGVTAKVKSVEMHDEAVLEAFPGDNVGFHVKKVDAKDLKRGYVASNSIDDPAKEAASFTCLVTIMKHSGLLFNGRTLTLDCHTARVPAKIVEILSKIDRRSGMEIEKEPEFLKNGDVAVMKMVPTKPIVVEAFSDYPPLGRFVARDGSQTVVGGVIKNVEKKEYPRGASNMKFDAKEAAKRSGAALRGMLPLLVIGGQCFLGVGENEM
ncbi:elongation factor 1-alpha [Ziziphus jujuba]|uniref:Elongation factor 1-alpha n=2 Tax=Ziziphus jujuba TaxID=326968 RepID=A0A6P3ZYP3_ZIZJJ|nr:elongation factor 1-alpha [Ziziphus jujuba]XP_015887299.2 elongation factor 1-alpha [Ziziphus jujuba]XP_048333683.2 elongation factor 1-alpha [Ziziphus jujuba]KAH7521697.1 hypothetical protein FEM48_Zijuj07G0060300 [Ziziphus jujuba var. spinosa]